MIDTIFNIERIEYKTNLTAQDFKNKLNVIFNQGTFKHKYNLSGKFINDNEFKATDKWTIGVNIKSFEKDPAYLKGKIDETSNGIIIMFQSDQIQSSRYLDCYFRLLGYTHCLQQDLVVQPKTD